MSIVFSFIDMKALGRLGSPCDRSTLRRRKAFKLPSPSVSYVPERPFR